MSGRSSPDDYNIDIVEHSLSPDIKRDNLSSSESEDSSNHGNDPFADGGPGYPENQQPNLNWKDLFQGPHPKSLMTIKQSDIGQDCYDVTFMDGTTGTIVKSADDKSPPVMPESRSFLPRPIQRPPPMVLPLLPPPAPPQLPRMTNSSHLDPNKNLKDEEKKPLRPNARHHLVDIHGLSIFLWQSTRCFSCREARCLYVTGAISTQMAAVTKVKITCQRCQYTVSETLRLPSQMPEDAATYQMTKPLESSISTPPSTIPSPHQPPSPLDAYRQNDSHLPTPCKNFTKLENPSVTPNTAGKHLKGKESEQIPSIAALMQAVPFPLSESMKISDDVWSLEHPSASQGQNSAGKSHETDYSKVNLEWKPSDFTWTKRERSPSPESILPDIPSHSGKFGHPPENLW